MAYRKKLRRHRHSAVIYTPIAVLLIVIIAIFGVSIFFRVTDITVEGAERYSPDQILGASGLHVGDNLIFIDSKAVARRIGQALPYLSDVVIHKSIPDKVVVSVTESRAAAVVEYDAGWWIVDQKARVLEKTDMQGTAGKIAVSGLVPKSMTVGQTIAVGEAERTRLGYLIAILSAAESAGIAPDIDKLDITSIANISFTYDGRFTVVLGSGDNAEYKIERALGIAAQLGPEDTGRIDVSAERAHFIPAD